VKRLPARRPGSEGAIKLLAFLVIVLVFGSDLLVVAEMTSLLELLGATLLVLSIAYGAKMIGLSVLQKARELVAPVEWIALASVRRPRSALLTAAVQLGVNLVFVVCGAAMIFMCSAELVKAIA
jgi:hypothetical protein